MAPKRTSTASEIGIVSSPNESPPKKVAVRGAGVRREPCAKCGLPVFLAERLNIEKALYHRTCFRCARCNSQLTLVNYYETENNEFCCETCPDEEKLGNADKRILNKSLSDEEKSASLKRAETDDYSSIFETALEDPIDIGLKKNFTLDRGQQLTFSSARSQFIASQVNSDSDTGNEDDSPDSAGSKLSLQSGPNSTKLDSENMNNIDVKLLPSGSDSGFSSNKLDDKVNVNIVSANIASNQQNAASDELEETRKVTKDEKFQIEDREFSIVKTRMKLFEKESNVIAENRKSDVNNESPTPNVNEDVRNVPYNGPKSLGSAAENVISDADENCSPNLGKLENSESHSQIENITMSDDCSDRQNASVTDNSSDVVLVESERITDNSSDVMIFEPNVSVIEISTDSSKEMSNVDFDSSVHEFEMEKQEHEIVDTTDPISEPDSICQAASTDKKHYPTVLNPFGEDSENENESKVESLNPFDDTDEDEEPENNVESSPRLTLKKKLRVSGSDKLIQGTLEYVRESINPYEENYNKDNRKTPIPAARVKKVIQIPAINLNPFCSDDDDEEIAETHIPEHVPVPKPRITRTTVNPEDGHRSAGHSDTSLSSLSNTGKRKKPAPKPPSLLNTEANESPHSSLTSSPSHSVCHTPKSTPKFRKGKKAPLPPINVSTPIRPETISTTLEASTFISPIVPRSDNISSCIETSVASSNENIDFGNEKTVKDVINRNKQNEFHSQVSTLENSTRTVPNKSTFGKWKRRKGLAPSRPIPQKRIIRALPIGDIKRELDVIEIQQQGLEKQGVRLEQIIREKCEGPNSNADETLPPEVEDLILQLFELVNEKNDLFRKQAELMYIRRQQRLEEEHYDIEYQIRCLMLQPEANKTDSDKSREEELINRLVDIVERRNEIVECLEMDRVREAEEDDSISTQLNLFTLKRDVGKNQLVQKTTKKDKKKCKKEKKLKSKSNIDMDKDIDESESTTTMIKDKKKKKFNLF